MFLDHCTLLSCQGPRGCSRANKRLKADIKRSIAELKQNYNSVQWPLVCHPAYPCPQIDQQQLLGDDEHMPTLKPDILMCVAHYLLPRDLYMFVFFKQDIGVKFVSRGSNKFSNDGRWECQSNS